MLTFVTRDNLTPVSFVDDVGLLTASEKADTNVHRLASHLSSFIQLLTDSRLSIDPDKTELIHFTRSLTKPQNPAIFRFNDQTLTIRPAHQIRWLGFYLDTSLCFLQHSSLRGTKAASAIGPLRILSNSIRGLPHPTLRTLILSIVFPISFYGFQLWYREGCSETLLKLLMSSYHTSLRFVSGTFRTSSIKRLASLLSLPPPRILMSHWLRRYAFCIASLPDLHPLIHLINFPTTLFNGRLAIRAPPPPTFKNNALQYIVNTLPPNARSIFVSPHLYFYPYLLSNYPRISLSLPPPKQHRDQYLQAAKQLTTIASSDPTHLAVFTNGALLGQRTGSSAFVVFHQQAEILTCTFLLGTKATSFDGEIYALQQACQAVASLLPAHPHIDHVTLFSDSSSSLSQISNPPPKRQTNVLNSILSTLTTLHDNYPHLNIHLKWVPGHSADFPGNERADFLTKQIQGLPLEQYTSLTYSYQAIKEHTLSLFQNWLSHDKSGFIQPPIPARLSLHKSLRKMPERNISAMLFQTLVGHTFVGSYYQRFNIPEPVSCPCGQPLQTIYHVLHSCPRFTSKRPLEFSQPNSSFRNLLLHPDKYHILYSFLSDYKPFAKSVQLDPQPP